jgi:CheY-like chemotaxis protein
MLHVDTELKRMFDTVVLDPDQWKGWSCIYFKDPDLGVFAFAKELLYETEVKLHTYLKGIEGSLFMGGFENIYVFYESTDLKELEQLGRNICELINPDCSEKIDINQSQVKEFENDVVRTSNLFSPLNSAFYLYDSAVESDQIPSNDLRSLSMGKTKVLIVEDDPTTRWKYRKILKNDCLLQTAGDANGAFSRYISHDPDIVFLDLNLPDGTGYAILDWILRNDPGANVVVCSGRDDDSSKERAFDSGAKGYITKPFKKQNLMNFIESCPSLH